MDQGKVWLHMESMEGQWSWLGTKSKYSQRPPPGHHVTFGPRKERDQIQHVLGLDSDSRTDSTCHTTVAYELGLGRSSTSWNPYEVYFHMDLESSPYLFWGGRNDWITTESLSVQRCCVTLVWSNGPCIKLGPLGTRPRVGERPQHPGGRPSTFIYPLAATKNSWILFRSSLALATCL